MLGDCAHGGGIVEITSNARGRNKAHSDKVLVEARKDSEPLLLCLNVAPVSRNQAGKFTRSLATELVDVVNALVQ